MYLHQVDGMECLDVVEGTGTLHVPAEIRAISTWLCDAMRCERAIMTQTTDNFESGSQT